MGVIVHHLAATCKAVTANLSHLHGQTVKRPRRQQALLKPPLISPEMNFRPRVLMRADGLRLQRTKGCELQAAPRRHTLNHHGNVLRLKLM